MTTPQMSRARLAGLILAMSFLFGNNFVALSVALRYAEPLTVQALAALVAVAAAWATTRNEPRQTVDRRGFVLSAAVIGLALTVGSPIFIILGVQRVEAGVVAMLVASTPIITLLLERLVLGQRVSRIQMAGMTVGILGVALIISPIGLGSSPQLDGVLFLLCGSLCWAGGLILTRRLPAVRGDGHFVVLQFLAGVPVLLCLAFLAEGLLVAWSWPFVVAVLYSGGLSKGLASVLQFRTVRLASPLHSSMAAFLVPAIGVVSGYIVLGESVLPVQIVGGSLVGLAVTLVVLGPSSVVRMAPPATT